MCNMRVAAEFCPVCFGSCVSKRQSPRSAFIRVCLLWSDISGGGFQSICPGLRSSLLQSAGSASIEKAEPRWPIQQPPRALIQLKMNSLNLWRRELQSWHRANRDSVTRARLNLLNMKQNLGNNLVSTLNWVCFPQQTGFSQAKS